MYRFIIPAIAIFCLMIQTIPVTHADEGGDIIFKDTKKFAPVLFSHAKHKAAGNQCTDCHDGIFQKRKGSADARNAVTMKAMKQGKYCGTCHNGDKAFKVSRTCKKCHIKGLTR